MDKILAWFYSEKNQRTTSFFISIIILCCPVFHINYIIFHNSYKEKNGANTQSYCGQKLKTSYSLLNFFNLLIPGGKKKKKSNALGKKRYCSIYIKILEVEYKLFLFASNEKMGSANLSLKYPSI